MRALVLPFGMEQSLNQMSVRFYLDVLITYTACELNPAVTSHGKLRLYPALLCNPGSEQGIFVLLKLEAMNSYANHSAG